MPCHCENDVIYMEEAHGNGSRATLGVNAADIQAIQLAFPFFGRWHVPGEVLFAPIVAER
jgi:hypothetical protein